MRQDFLQKKISVLLTVSDIFNSLRWASKIDTPLVQETVLGKRYSQIIYLELSGRFGNNSKKQEDLKFDDKLGA